MQSNTDEHKHRQSLSYAPAHSQAVSSSSSHIYVLQEGSPPTLHIHDWEGNLQTTVSHKQVGIHSAMENDFW